MALHHLEYRAVLDLVGEAHDAGGVHEMRSALLPALRRMVPAEYATYNEVGPGGPMLAIADPVLPEWAYAVWNRHAGENPLLARYVRTRDSRPYQWTDVAVMSEFRRTKLFRALYQPLGIDHQIGFNLPAPPELTIAVVLNRAKRVFSEAEREMLDLARPHLIQAYRNAQIKDALVALLNDVRRGVDAAGQGVVVLAGDGTVSFASAKAATLVARSGAGTLRVGEKPPHGLVSSERTAMVSLDGGDALLVRRVSGIDEGTSVLLLEPAKQALSADVLQGLGLTQREAEVLAWLARGTGTPEVAAELGVSARTIEKHAQAIYAKLGVRSRAQAVATAWAAAGAATAYA